MRKLANLAWVLLACSTTAAAPEPTSELIGLRSLPLAATDRLWGFDIALAEGRVVAVCRVPDGWTVTARNNGEAGNYKDGGGSIKGDADFGHDAFTGADFSTLGAFVLIDVSSVHHKPAVLSGAVRIDGERGNRNVVLRPENFARQKAVACSALARVR